MGPVRGRTRSSHFRERDITDDVEVIGAVVMVTQYLSSERIMGELVFLENIIEGICVFPTSDLCLEELTHKQQEQLSPMSERPFQNATTQVLTIPHTQCTRVPLL